MTYQGCILGVDADQFGGLNHREGVWLGRAILHTDARLEEVVQPGNSTQTAVQWTTDDIFREREKKGAQKGLLRLY